MATLSTGLVHHPIQGETVCGDAYCVVEHEDYVLVTVIDGLGHGAEAEFAAAMAIRYVQAHAELGPLELIEGIHLALRATRGAVGAVVRIDRAAHTLTHAGLGNIECRIVGVDKTHRPVSINGILGHQARKFRQEVFPFVPGDLLILHSDGISDRFEVSAAARDIAPQMLANRITLENGKQYDDQLILVVRIEP